MPAGRATLRRMRSTDLRTMFCPDRRESCSSSWAETTLKTVFSAFENLRQIVGKIQDQGALVVIGGIKIPLWGAELEKEYQQLARETGSLIVPNIYKDVFGNSSRMSDPIHPNDAGYRIIATRFREVLAPYL